MKKQKLILEQIDRKIIQLRKVEELSNPPSGWVKAIRQSLGMSLRQLGLRMGGIKAQSVKEIEERESNDTISIKVLKQFANSLNMKFVYGFVPRDKSLEEMIEFRAREIAKKIVLRTSINMKLEDQENVPKRIEKAINEKAIEIKLEMPKYLWD